MCRTAVVGSRCLSSANFFTCKLAFSASWSRWHALVAHGDIDSLKSHKVGRSYSADEILDRMAKLRPHFFPIAMREVRVTKID